jgi:predicted transcriptional regulator
MSRRSDLIRSIDEIEKFLEDLEKMQSLLSKHLDTGTPKVKEAYDNVTTEIQQTLAMRERLKYALALEEQERRDSGT